MNKTYECKFCGTKIPDNTNDKFVYCSCRKIGIIGNVKNTRIIRGSSYVKINEEKTEFDYTYRIKNISSGLYYRPLSHREIIRGRNTHFTKKGKFYASSPSLKWVPKHYGECVIEKYKIIRECIE